MAEYGFHTNRKARRAIDGPFGSTAGDIYVPYEWVGESDPPRKSRSAERNWQPLANADGSGDLILNHEDAWRWMRAQQLDSEHILAPTVDEMIEAISDELRRACEEFMNTALHSEEGLATVYHQRDLINVRWWKGGF